MLYKIILKNYKSNIRTYILFFVSNILTISILFLFWGINDIIKMSITDRITALTLKTDFSIAASIITIVTAVLLIFSMKYYIQLRSKDYGMYIVLGMKKNIVLLMMMTEYIAGYILSIFLGVFLGKLFFVGIQKIIYSLYPQYIRICKIQINVYRNVCIMSVGIMIVVAIILLIWMDNKNISYFLETEDVKEQRPVSTKWMLMVNVGVLLLVIGEILFQGSDENYTYSHLIWLLGIIIIVSFSGGIILQILRKKEKAYFSHILSINQLYSKYQNNLLILIILIAIHFFSFTYLSVQMAETLPLNKYKKNYHYDMIWMTNSKNQYQAENICKKYKGKLISIPALRVVTYYDAQNIGISESSYKRLTGKKNNLKGKEIVLEIQSKNKKEKIEDNAYEKIYKLLYMTQDIGKEQDEDRNAALKDEEKVFKIKSMYTGNSIGKYSTDGWHENVIIFSDKFFDKKWNDVKNKKTEIAWINLYDIPKEKREEAYNELKDFDKESGVENKIPTMIENNYYSTELFVKGEKVRELFNFGSKMFLMILLSMCGFFVIGLKNLTEKKVYIRKCEFLRCLGMKSRDRERIVRIEVKLLSEIAIFMDFFMGIVYVFSYIKKEMKTGNYINIRFWKYWIFIQVIYIGINLILVQGFAFYMSNKIDRE